MAVVTDSSSHLDAAVLNLFLEAPALGYHLITTKLTCHASAPAVTTAGGFASVSRSGAGIYVLTYSAAFVTAAFVVGAVPDDGGVAEYKTTATAGLTTVTVYVYTAAGAASDACDYVYVTVVGK